MSDNNVFVHEVQRLSVEPQPLRDPGNIRARTSEECFKREMRHHAALVEKPKEALFR